ncbi:hypothetical protein HZB02_04070 [Candidatus Woesearchaeota archaeon]|nr:hypothetical protein [Candidatus Woesearchaeota archaeon]
MALLRKIIDWFRSKRQEENLATVRRRKRSGTLHSEESDNRCETRCKKGIHYKECHPQTNCVICGREPSLIKDFFCKYCGKWHCQNHRLPENHKCPNPKRPKDLIQTTPESLEHDK